MKAARNRFVLSCLFCFFGVPENATAGEHSGAGLARDLTTIVLAEEQQSWGIDRYEIQSMMPQALLSVCTASAEARVAAQAQLSSPEDEIKRLWSENGESFDGLEKQLTRHRASLLLASALTRASNECPFYLLQQEPFLERQRAVGRWFLSFGGGGLLNIRLGQDEARGGGGGAGRAALGYGLSPNWSVRQGVEWGGAGLVNKELDTEDINVDMYFALPLTLRHRGDLWHQDVDLAATRSGIPWKGDGRYGARIAGLVGITYPRVGSIQPWGGLRLGAEYAFPDQGDAGFVTLRFGLRVGVNYHL